MVSLIKPEKDITVLHILEKQSSLALPLSHPRPFTSWYGNSEGEPSPFVAVQSVDRTCDGSARPSARAAHELENRGGSTAAPAAL